MSLRGFLKEKRPDVGALKREIITLKEDRNTAQWRADEIEKRVLQLEADLKAAREEIEKGKEDLNIARSSCSTLTGDNARLQGIVNQQDLTIFSLRKDYATLEEEAQDSVAEEFGKRFNTALRRLQNAGVAFDIGAFWLEGAPEPDPEPAAQADAASPPLNQDAPAAGDGVADDIIDLYLSGCDRVKAESLCNYF